MQVRNGLLVRLVEEARVNDGEVLGSHAGNRRFRNITWRMKICSCRRCTHTVLPLRLTRDGTCADWSTSGVQGSDRLLLRRRELGELLGVPRLVLFGLLQIRLSSGLVKISPLRSHHLQINTVKSLQLQREYWAGPIDKLENCLIIN